MQPCGAADPLLLGGGILVAPDDPADLARGLRRLVEDLKYADELATRGKAVVHERFHAQRMAEETAAVYAQYIHQSS